MKKNHPSVQSRLESFVHAFAGLRDMMRTQRNAWIHAFATALTLFLAFWLRIGKEPFSLIVIAIVGVWVAEAFNTVLELMANLVARDRYSVLVKRANDIAAAAVLIAALGAVCVGISIFGPLLYERFVSGSSLSVRLT